MTQKVKRKGFLYKVGIKKNTLDYRYQQEQYIGHLIEIIKEKESDIYIYREQNAKLQRQIDNKKWWQFWK